MSETHEAVAVEVRGRVAHVRFNRPAVRNAFDDRVALALAEIFEGFERRADLQAVVLGGHGDVFCAGGDLNWMRRVAEYTREENLRDAEAFQRAFERIDRCPLPVVGRVQGAALGGGAGLVAVCDVAVAAESTRFGFPEVRLGLVPGVISPYVLRRIGMGHTRHLFLTGERFDAAEAHRIGLVHRVVPEAQLDAAVDDVLGQLAQCAPGGMRGVKVLLRRLPDAEWTEALNLAREAITDARASGDGREGLSAFLQKRKPRWLP